MTRNSDCTLNPTDVKIDRVVPPGILYDFFYRLFGLYYMTKNM